MVPSGITYDLLLKASGKSDEFLVYIVCGPMGISVTVVYLMTWDFRDFKDQSKYVDISVVKLLDYNSFNRGNGNLLLC